MTIKWHKQSRGHSRVVYLIGVHSSSKLVETPKVAETSKLTELMPKLIGNSGMVYLKMAWDKATSPFSTSLSVELWTSSMVALQKI